VTTVAPLAAQHHPYFVQQMEVSDELSGIPRWEVLSGLLAGKNVLHVGCADWPITDPTTNLHVQLDAVCSGLDGFDPHQEAMQALAPYVRGRLFTDWSQITDSYDILLVPEVLEHVSDVSTFFEQLDSVDFGAALITVPDAFQCRNGHFEYDATTSLFTEVVHPDHNVWFTPYTFSNIVRKHTNWSVDGLWFYNRMSLMMLASKPAG